MFHRVRSGLGHRCRPGSQRLGPGGEAAAQALAARVGREMAQGRADAANPATASVDEHVTVGMPRNAADLGAANRDSANAAAAGTRTAAQLAGEWYPGINSPRVPAHVAGKRPANPAPAQTPARTAGRAR
jgi:hypothetical protein